MVKNQKGYTGLEFLAIGLIAYVVGSLVAPLVKPFIPGLNGGEGKQTVQSQSYKETIEPYAVNGVPQQATMPDGTPVLLFKATKTTANLNQETTPRAPLIERIIMWFVRLGVAGIALALLFPTLAVTVWVWIRRRWAALSAEIEEHKKDVAFLKTGTKKIVDSVDAGFIVFDNAIKSAQATYDTAKTLAANTTDPTALAAHQAIMSTQQNVMALLTGMEKQFKDEMTKVQGSKSRIEGLVTQAQQGQL